jgi:hypothetical protein
VQACSCKRVVASVIVRAIIVPDNSLKVKVCTGLVGQPEIMRLLVKNPDFTNYSGFNPCRAAWRAINGSCLLVLVPDPAQA